MKKIFFLFFFVGELSL